MTQIVKLEIGAEAIFVVRSVAVDKAGKWPDYHFTAEDGTVYGAPKAAIDRQLERLTLSVLELGGTALRLSRAPNKDDAKKSWWNLDLATPNDVRPKPESKRIPSPTVVPGEAPASYGRMTQEQALSAPPAHHRDAGIPDSPDTLFTASAGQAGDISTPMRQKMDAYFALAREVADFQAGLATEFDIPVDGSSVNAMTYSIWNSR